MAKINSYPIVNPTNDDLILGTDATRADQPTKNFKVSSLIALVTGGATGLGTVISLNQSAKSPFTPFNNQSAIDFLNITGTGTVTFNSLTDGTFNTTGGATTTSTLTTTGNITSSTIIQAATFQTTAGTAKWTETILTGFTSITTSALVINGAVSGTSLIIATDLAGASNTNIASTLAIKTYVDGKIENQDTLAELLAKRPSPLANPSNTTGGTDIDVSSTDDINLTWNTGTSVGAKIFGAGESIAGAAQLEQLQVYAEGANSYINHTGSPTGVGADGLYIRSSDSIILTAQTGGEKRAEFINNGAVDLYHNGGTPKLSTSSTGVTVTGTVLAAVGTKELPSYTFTGDVDTGMFHPAANEIGFSTQEVLRLKVSNSGIDVTGAIDATSSIEGLSFTTDTTTSSTKITRFVLDTDPAVPQTDPTTFGLFVTALVNNTMVPTTKTVKTYVDTIAGAKVLKYQADAAATGTMPFSLNLSTDSLDIAGGTNMNTSTLAVTAGNLGVVTVNLDDNVTLPTATNLKGVFTGKKYADAVMNIEAGVGSAFKSITITPDAAQPPGAANASGFFGPLRASAASTNITAGVADQAVKLVTQGTASVGNDIQVYPSFSLATNEIVAANAQSIVLASVPVNNQTPIIGQKITGTNVVGDTLITGVTVGTPANKVTIAVDKQQTAGIAAGTTLSFATSAPIYTSGGPIVIPTFLPNTTATSKLLTGLVNGSATPILNTDSILGGMQNLQAQITDIPQGLVYKGTWNAATNDPTLVSGVGTSGEFYIVNNAGNTDLDGITDWLVGDWAIFVEVGATDTWQKIDNTSEITGGGGAAGDIALFTSAQNIAPSVMNQTGSAGSFKVTLGSNSDFTVTGDTQLGDANTDTTLVKGPLSASKTIVLSEGFGVPLSDGATPPVFSTNYGAAGQALFSGGGAGTANIWKTVEWTITDGTTSSDVSNGNTVTFSKGNGLTVGESSKTVTYAIDYLGVDNAILSATDLSTGTIALTDQIWFNDIGTGASANTLKYAPVSKLKDIINTYSWDLNVDGGTASTVGDGNEVDFISGTGIVQSLSTRDVTTALRYEDSDNAGTIKNFVEAATTVVPTADDLLLFGNQAGGSAISKVSKATISSIVDLGNETLTQVLANGNNSGGAKNINMTGAISNITLVDSGTAAAANAAQGRIQLGTGADLQIYHNGTNGYITNSTGGLILEGTSQASLGFSTGESGVTATKDSDVKLYNDNRERLRTTSGGVEIVNTDDANSFPSITMTQDGNLFTITTGLSGNAELRTQGSMSLNTSGVINFKNYASTLTKGSLGDSFDFNPANAAGTGVVNGFNVGQSSDATAAGTLTHVYGDLQVDGAINHGGGKAGIFNGNVSYTDQTAAPLFTLTRATTGQMIFDVLLTSGTASGTVEKFVVAHKSNAEPVFNKVIGIDGTPDFTVAFTNATKSGGTAGDSVLCTITPTATQVVSYTVNVGFDNQNSVTIV